MGRLGLEEKLPAWMSKGKEQDIGSPMRTQTVEDGIDPLQEGDKVGRGAM